MNKEFIERAKARVKEIVAGCSTDSHTVIARYTAAIAVNFTDWIGKTAPWVRHEVAYCALVDNLRCESEQDHVEMLLRFAELSQALPNQGDCAHMKDEVAAVRRLFKNPATAGLSGLALLAILENTSEEFILDLARRAKLCGCTDFTYTDVHGVADAEHSEAFLVATQAERTMGYENDVMLVTQASDAAINLIAKIYA